jgi:hypothetical protein
MDYTHWLQSGLFGVRSPADLFGGTDGSSADCISNPEVGGDTREGLLWLDNLESRRPSLVAYEAKGRLATASAGRRITVVRTHAGA